MGSPLCTAKRTSGLRQSSTLCEMDSYYARKMKNYENEWTHVADMLNRFQVHYENKVTTMQITNWFHLQQKKINFVLIEKQKNDWMIVSIYWNQSLFP